MFGSDVQLDKVFISSNECVNLSLELLFVKENMTKVGA
jgi:hypothetical protein